MSGIPYESFAIKRHAFQARLLDAMSEPEFSQQMWEAIRVVQHKRETEKIARWVEQRRAAYAAKPWYKRLFSVRPL